jgi:methionyl aminopeptidase
MILKTEEEILIMREPGKILAEIMDELKKKVAVGITTASLNDFAEKRIKERGGGTSFKGHRGFPAALCTSINEVIVHGIPSNYKLKDGDILSLDLGFFYKGFHTDMAVTVPVGEVSGETMRLIRETKKALKRGIKKTREGNTLGDIGNTILRHIEKAGFSNIQGLCGHGIGREVHEEPQVLNEGKRGKGMPLEIGMVLCLEPMLSVGSPYIKESSDGMGIETADNSLSAHFEHTIAITKKGVKVLTEL